MLNIFTKQMFTVREIKKETFSKETKNENVESKLFSNSHPSIFHLKTTQTLIKQSGHDIETENKSHIFSFFILPKKRGRVDIKVEYIIIYWTSTTINKFWSLKLTFLFYRPKLFFFFENSIIFSVNLVFHFRPNGKKADQRNLFCLKGKKAAEHSIPNCW